MPIVKSNLRLVALLDVDGLIQMEFSDNVNDSHRDLYNRLSNRDDIKQNFDIPLYGRFYTMLYGNSRYPQLIIYGSSSNYSIEDIGHHKDIYEKKLRDYSNMNNWDILFLP